LANAYLTPTGVLLGVADTVVYTAPALTGTMVIVYFNNVDTANRKLNAFVYTGAGPGADITRILPTDFTLVKEAQLQLGPIYLPAGYKIAAKCDVANKINALPVGVETT